MKKQISQQHKKYLRKLALGTTFTHIARIGLLLVLIGLWELMAQSGMVDPFITSSPSRIVKYLGSMINSGTIWTHVWVTLKETIWAFAISTILGSLIAILLMLCMPLKRVMEPYLVVLNSLPKIALGPLIIIWMGVGEPAIITMGVLICIVITTISMLNGFLSIEQEKIMLMKSLGANKLQILFKLILPASLPNFISVLKINVGMAWVGVIMGEYLSSRAGLGYLLVYGGQVFALDLVMTTIVILCILAGLMYMLIAMLEMYVNHKRK